MARRWGVWGLVVCLCMIMIPAVGFGEFAPDATARPIPETADGSLRVWLQSLSGKQALGLTLEGAYSVDGDRGFQFAPGTEIALGLDGGSIVLRVGGAVIDMGGSFTLRRHLDDEGNAGGAYIHESELNTLYRGDLSFAARNESLRVILTIDIEEYLYGVVPYEMREDFPIEALKAQSVAARTYAMQRKSRRGGEEYDLVDTADDQVFKGYNAQLERPIQAVNETRGIVGMYNGQYAECFYSASNGGQTALATDVWGQGDFGYLTMRDDPYDLANPDSIVRQATVPRDGPLVPEALYALLVEAAGNQLIASGDLLEGEAVGIAEVMSVEAVDPVYGGESRQYGTIRFQIKPSVSHFLGEEGGHIRMLGEVEVLEDVLTVDLSFYDQVRSALGIGINSSRYDLVTTEEAEDGFVLTTRRYGHGVGLSQRGAEWMAQEEGKSHLEILHYYYPGMELVQLTWQDMPLTHADALPDSLGYAAPQPTPAPTPGPLPALQGGEYYAVVSVEGTDGTLNVRGGPSMDDGVIAKIRNGARLIVEEELEGDWARMKTAEVEGYVSMAFIVREDQLPAQGQEEAQTPEETAPPAEEAQ